MMQDYSLNILSLLHKDHMATLALLERVETQLRGCSVSQVPDGSDDAMNGLLADMNAVLKQEISTHFAFEEEHLFPKFSQMFDPGIPMMLQGEHEVIRPLAARLREIIAASEGGAFTAENWAEFLDKAQELVEREVFHVQKEEMGFLPALQRLLSAEDDEVLTNTYNHARGPEDQV